MAAIEAFSVIDQTADKHVEQMTVGDDIKHVDEESVSQPKDLEGKCEEEKLKVEDSTTVEASVTEEVKPEVNESNSLVEEQKKAREGEIIEKEPEPEAVQKPAVKAPSLQVSENDAAKEAVVLKTTMEEVTTEGLPELSTAVEPASVIAGDPDVSGSAEILQGEKTSAEEVEVSPESSKEEPSSSETSVQGTAVEVKEDKGIEGEGPTSSETTKPTAATEVTEVPSEGGGVEKADEEEGESSEVDKTSLVEANETSVKGTAVEVIENKGIEGEGPTSSETTKPAAASEVSELPSEGGGVEKAEEEGESSEVDKTGLVVTNETSVQGAAVEKREDKGIEGEGPTSSETTKPAAATEVTEVPSEGGGVEKAEEEEGEGSEVDKTSLVEANEDLDAASEVAELSTEGEMASGGVGGVEEKSRSLEGDKTTVVETSIDLDLNSTAKELVSGLKEAESEPMPAEAIQSGKLVNEDSEDKKDESGEANDAKDGSDTKAEGEAPQKEVPVEMSQRQSNSIVLKMRQSFVKVKKAIIGKSLSSKTMSSESKDDSKK